MTQEREGEPQPVTWFEVRISEEPDSDGTTVLSGEAINSNGVTIPLKLTRNEAGTIIVDVDNDLLERQQRLSGSE
jgi:hypothetical protein